MIWACIGLLIGCSFFIMGLLVWIADDSGEFDSTWIRVMVVIATVLFVCVFLKSVTMITYITNPEKKRIPYYQIEEYVQEMVQEQPESESYLSEFLNRLQTTGEENE